MTSKANESEIEIEKIMNGECTRRWTEQGRQVVCGHLMPCPEHTDVIFWKADIINQITDKFRIIPKTDSPATWVTIDEVTIKKADEAIITFSAKLKWRKDK